MGRLGALLAALGAHLEAKDPRSRGRCTHPSATRRGGGPLKRLPADQQDQHLAFLHAPTCQEARWRINEASQELIMGTPRGAIKTQDFTQKGSDEERWSPEEINGFQGLPWQPDPNTANMDVLPRVMIPLERPREPVESPETRPLISRGVMIKREEYIAMGPTEGRHGCRAIARGDTTHKPHDETCRARAIRWLKSQGDHKIQERLANAQMRMDPQTKDKDKRASE